LGDVIKDEAELPGSQNSVKQKKEGKNMTFFKKRK